MLCAASVLFIVLYHISGRIAISFVIVIYYILQYLISLSGSHYSSSQVIIFEDAVSFHIIISTIFVRYANLSCKRLLSVFERVKMRMTGQNAKGM